MTRKVKESKNFERLIAVGALLVSAAGLGYTIFHNHQVSRSSEERFGKIETALRMLTETVAPQLYKSVDDSLSSATIQTNGDAAKTLLDANFEIKQLQNLQPIPDSSRITRSGTLLSAVVNTHPDLPETWQTAAQLITYRSVASNNIPLTSKPCRNMNIVIDGERGVDGVYEHLELSNCVMDLDNNPAIGWNDMPGYEYLVLHNVRIRYKGGEIPNLGRVLFDHCVFEFQINVVPPAPAQYLTKTLLLASDINKVSFKPLGTAHS